MPNKDFFFFFLIIITISPWLRSTKPSGHVSLECYFSWSNDTTAFLKEYQVFPNLYTHSDLFHAFLHLLHLATLSLVDSNLSRSLISLLFSPDYTIHLCHHFFFFSAFISAWWLEVIFLWMTNAQCESIRYSWKSYLPRDTSLQSLGRNVLRPSEELDEPLADMKHFSFSLNYLKFRTGLIYIRDTIFVKGAQTWDPGSAPY